MADDAFETTSRLAQDGLERADETDDAAATTPEAGQSLGFILDEPDKKKVAKHTVKLWQDQEPAMQRRRAVWKRNRWWREGRRWVRLEKKQDQSLWEAKLPSGMGSAPPVPNKTDRLCRRIVNTILVDPPYPECEPGDDSNEARDAAEFATRYLSVKGAPAELNMKRVCRAGADKAQTYASAFGWVTMDPTAGGHRPRSMLAHPEATQKDDALIDPRSGMAAPDDALVERFQRPDGTLSDDPQEADLQWLPRPRIRTLTGLQVRFLPERARGMDDAIGVLIADTTTLGDLKAQFPDAIEALSEEELKTLCKWRPEHIEDLLPPYTPEPEDQRDERGNYKDAQLVIALTVYYESCAEYPYGCYAVIGGDTLVLHRQKWSATMPADDGASVEECLELPVGQCRCLDDDTFDDGYGIGIVEHLGPADEIRASAIGFELMHMFRAGNPIPFLPIGSIVQPKQFLLRDGTPVFTNPQGKPEWENVSPLSPSIPELREEMGHEMDDESGLQQAGQGVEDPSVKSGIHAQTIVQEALKAVANMKDNIGDYYIALNRIILQLSRAYCAVSDLLSYTGKDGQYKVREFTRADFRTTKVVSIAKGSYTMHTLLAKQEMANNAFDRKVIDAEDYQELVAGGVSPVLGVQDNPDLLRVRRQIDAFNDGPPEGWLETTQQIAQQTQQRQVVTAQYAQLGLQPPPMATIPPAPTHPFSVRWPIDLEPMAAKIRHRQLHRAIASTKFETFPPEWQQLLLAEYAEMKNAAGVMTVPEVQKAQADQQAAAAAAAANALPKGVSIAMKADESNVAAEEQAARAGIQAPPAAPTPAAAAAPPVAPPQVHVHLAPEVSRTVEHVRDAGGRITHSRIVPHAPAGPGALPA